MRKFVTTNCNWVLTVIKYSLKPIDIVVLKKLSEVVNVVPVIAKSDSLTIEERAAFKQRIKAELVFHNIKLYPYESDEDDEQEQALNESIRVSKVNRPYCFTDHQVGFASFCYCWF
jgi:septin 3/9/12